MKKILCIMLGLSILSGETFAIPTPSSSPVSPTASNCLSVDDVVAQINSSMQYPSNPNFIIPYNTTRTVNFSTGDSVMFTCYNPDGCLRWATGDALKLGTVTQTVCGYILPYGVDGGWSTHANAATPHSSTIFDLQHTKKVN